MFQLFSKPQIGGLSAADAVAGAKSGKVTVIDVREHGEVAMSGKAQGAKHIPLFQLAMRADPSHPDYDKDLSPEQTICLYCASGARSASAQQVLKRLGYKDLHNLGNLNKWVKAGGKIVKS
jgi:rhodanese-related sulfurtransferase